MSINLVLRYQKKDAYGNVIFIASNKFDAEKDAYGGLVKIEKKLKKMDINTFLPIYANADAGYASIRFKYYEGIKLSERNLYKVSFDIKKNLKDDKEYINCFVKYVKLHAKASPINYGETLEFAL
jgi:hypothetical protein